MPIYEVWFSPMLVDAPNVRAARIYYFNQVKEWYGVFDLLTEEATGEVAEHTVDADGNEIEEEEE